MGRRKQLTQQQKDLRINVHTADVLISEKNKFSRETRRDKETDLEVIYSQCKKNLFSVSRAKKHITRDQLKNLKHKFDSEFDRNIYKPKQLNKQFEKLVSQNNRLGSFEQGQSSNRTFNNLNSKSSSSFQGGNTRLKGTDRLLKSKKEKFNRSFPQTMNSSFKYSHRLFSESKYGCRSGFVENMFERLSPGNSQNVSGDGMGDTCFSQPYVEFRECNTDNSSDTAVACKEKMRNSKSKRKLKAKLQKIGNVHDEMIKSNHKKSSIDKRKVIKNKKVNKDLYTVKEQAINDDSVDQIFLLPENSERIGLRDEKEKRLKILTEYSGMVSDSREGNTDSQQENKDQKLVIPETSDGLTNEAGTRNWKSNIEKTSKKLDFNSLSDISDHYNGSSPKKIKCKNIKNYRKSSEECNVLSTFESLTKTNHSGTKNLYLCSQNYKCDVKGKDKLENLSSRDEVNKQMETPTVSSIEESSSKSGILVSSCEADESFFVPTQKSLKNLPDLGLKKNNEESEERFVSNGVALKVSKVLKASKGHQQATNKSVLSEKPVHDPGNVLALGAKAYEFEILPENHQMDATSNPKKSSNSLESAYSKSRNKKEPNFVKICKELENSCNIVNETKHSCSSSGSRSYDKLNKRLPTKKKVLKLKLDKSKTFSEQSDDKVTLNLPRLGIDLTESDNENGQIYEIQESSMDGKLNSTHRTASSMSTSLTSGFTKVNYRPSFESATKAQSALLVSDNLKDDSHISHPCDSSILKSCNKRTSPSKECNKVATVNNNNSTPEPKAEQPTVTNLLSPQYDDSVHSNRKRKLTLKMFTKKHKLEKNKHCHHTEDSVTFIRNLEEDFEEKSTDKTSTKLTRPNTSINCSSSSSSHISLQNRLVEKEEFELNVLENTSSRKKEEEPINDINHLKYVKKHKKLKDINLSIKCTNKSSSSKETKENYTEKSACDANNKEPYKLSHKQNESNGLGGLFKSLKKQTNNNTCMATAINGTNIEERKSVAKAKKSDEHCLENSDNHINQTCLADNLASKQRDDEESEIRVPSNVSLNSNLLNDRWSNNLADFEESEVNDQSKLHLGDSLNKDSSSSELSSKTASFCSEEMIAMKSKNTSVNQNERVSDIQDKSGKDLPNSNCYMVSGESEGSVLNLSIHLEDSDSGISNLSKSSCIVGKIDALKTSTPLKKELNQCFTGLKSAFKTIKTPGKDSKTKRCSRLVAKINSFENTSVSANKPQASTKKQQSRKEPCQGRMEMRNNAFDKTLNISASQGLLEETINDIQAILISSEDDVKRLKQLNIEVDWELPRLHQLDTGSQKMSYDRLKKKLDEENIKITTSSLTEKEVELIKNNWKDFSKKYKFLDPAVFMPSRQVFGKFKLQERLKFKQYLAKGLPDRRLFTVYKKFCDLYGASVKGRWSEKEDRLLMDLYKALDESDGEIKWGMSRHTVLCKALNRNWMCVYNRIQCLQRNGFDCSITEEPVHWTPELNGKLIRCILKKTKNSCVEELRYATIPYKVWHSVSVRMNIPFQEVLNNWRFVLYPKLFCRQEIARIILYEELIKWFHQSEIRRWNEVDWSDLSKRAGDLGPCFLMKCFKCIVSSHVPKNLHKDLRACVSFLFENYLPHLKQKEESRVLGRLKYIPDLRIVEEVPNVTKLAPYKIE